MELNDVVNAKDALEYDMPQPARGRQEGASWSVRPVDTLRFLRLVETLYHRTRISEWGMAFVRWIVFVGEHVRPVACYKLADVAAHFHLSERQTWRNLQALQKSQLLHITVCFDRNGKKTKYRRYDCTPFLNSIAGLMREYLRSGQLADTSVCSTNVPVAAFASCMTSSSAVAKPLADVCPSFTDRAVAKADVLEDRAVAEADVLEDRSVAKADVLEGRAVAEADVLEDRAVAEADVLDATPESCMTLGSAMGECMTTERDRCVPDATAVIGESASCMTLCPAAAAGACLPTSDAPVMPCPPADGTDVSASAASSTGAAHESAMSWVSVFCALATSNSNSNLEYNNNYNNIISNSNSRDTHVREAVDNCLIPPTFFTASFSDGDTCDPQCCEQAECLYPSVACPVQASEQLSGEDQQASCVQRRKSCAAPAGEPGCEGEPAAKSTSRRDRGAKARERERINALLAESRAASDEELGTHAKFTIHRITLEFNDNCAPSSCSQATTLYRHLLRINAVEDQYTLTDPDLFFTEMLQETYERLRHLEFRRTDSQRRPNGMPLFFTDLRGQVVQLVEHIQRLRERELLPASSDDEQQGQGTEQQRAEPAWRPERPLQNADEPLSVSDSHRLSEYVRTIPLDDPRELVAQARRLEVVLSDEEASQILAGTASEELHGLIVTAVRQGFYYEIKDSCVVQTGYGIR